MRDGQSFRWLGFVRLSDYVVERLGLSQRSAQELMRVEEALARLPLTAAAFESGALSSSHVRLLTRAATPETEAFWIGLARRVGVRELAARVGEAAERRTGVYGDSAAANDGDEEGGASERIEIAVPVSVVTLWRETLTLVRRLLGWAAPAGACLEAVLAEFDAGAAVNVEAAAGSGIEGPTLPGDADVPELPASASSGAAELGLHGAASSDAAERDLHRSASVDAAAPDLHGYASSGAADRGLHWSPSSCIPGEPTPAGEDVHGEDVHIDDAGDPRALDAELRRLVTERQRQEAALAAHLRAVGSERRYRLVGFSSLEAYASERFGLSPRRLHYLLSLRRTLERLPVLHEAFIGGRVTLKQTLLLGRVAGPATASAWIRRAESITLRRLEDETEFWLHVREARPGVWALLKGGPIPEGVSLVPGRAPRLLSSASPMSETGMTEASATPSSDELHAFARSISAEETVPPAASPLDAEVFMRALDSDETAAPLPDRTCRIRMHVEPGIMKMWDETVARCRVVTGPELKEWEVLVLAMNEFWKTWDNVETRRQRRENPILERDGWRCAAPACRSVGTGRLQVHHVQFRSAGGSDDSHNLSSQCVGHHLGLLHEGKMRCSGRAPDELRWELGMERGLEPFLVYEGETRIGGVAM